MNDKIDRFPIYRNSYNLTKFLSKTKQEKMALAILEYVFEDKDPVFSDEESKTLWENIGLILKKTKKQVLNGKKGGAPKKANEEPKMELNEEPMLEPNKETNLEPNNIYYFKFIISKFVKENNYCKDIEVVLNKWIKYRNEKKSLPTQTSFNELLNAIKLNINKHGTQKITDLINNCIASNYQAIIFEKLNNVTSKDPSTTPNWYGKEIKPEEMTADEIRKLEDKMRKAGVNV